MNIKTFLFWAGVGIVILAGSFLVIRWFSKREQQQLAEEQNKATQKLAEPRREAGFHAIAKDHATAVA